MPASLYGGNGLMCKNCRDSENKDDYSWIKLCSQMDVRLSEVVLNLDKRIADCLVPCRGGSRDFKGGVHNQRYACIHHTECPSLEGGSKSGMVTQIK